MKKLQLYMPNDVSSSLLKSLLSSRHNELHAIINRGIPLEMLVLHAVDARTVNLA